MQDVWGLDSRKFYAFLLVPVYLVLVAILLVLDIRISYNPPILLLVFNGLFLGLIPLYAASIAYRSFGGSRSTSVLLMGTGMLLLGLGATAAGIVNFFPDSMNINVTVHNTSFCAGAFLQMAGILVVLSGTTPKPKPGNARAIALLYGGCVLVVVSFIIADVLGWIPPFYVPGSGFSVLREVIISSAIEFFLIASGVLLYIYSRKREDFFFWYSIGLALIGIGLLAVHFPSVLGSPLGWTGRSAQYLGACFVLIAFISIQRSANETGISLEEMLSRFFSEAGENYKLLVETATDAIVVFDPADRIIVWNRAAEEMFGYSLTEATGASFIRLAIPDEFAGVLKSYTGRPAPEAGTAAQTPVEITARRKDGSTFPVELTISRHLVTGTWVSTCIVRDLTRRKRTEEALRESEREYRLLFTGMQEGVYRAEMIFDNGIPVDFRYLDVNPAFERLMGMTRDQLAGRTATEAVPRLKPSWVRVLGNVAVTGEPVRYEESSEVFRKHFEIVAFRLRENEVAVLVNDITQRKRAEDHLRDQAKILAVINDAIVVTDTSYRIRSWNARAEELYGWKEAEVSGRLAKEILRSEIIGMDRNEAYTRLERGEPVIMESVQYTKDDRKLFVHGYTVPLRDAEGTTTGYVAVNHDITERKRMEEQLQTTLQRFYLTLSGMHYGILLVTDENRVEFVNPAFCDIFGLKDSPADLSGLSADEIIKKIRGSYRDPDASVARIREIVRLGKPVHGEEVDLIGGRTFLREFIPILLGEKQFGRQWNHIDITERKRAEENLIRAHKRIAAILEGIADTFYSLDSQWRFTLVNPAAEKAPFGRPAAELLGRNIWELFPALVGTRIHRHYLDAAENHTMEHYESQSPLNGQWYEVFMQGREGGIDVYMRDITDRKRAEIALVISEQRLRFALFAAKAGTWEWDLQTNENVWSDETWQLYGLEPGSGTPSFDLWLRSIHPDDREQVARTVNKAAENGTYLQAQWRVSTADGTERWLMSRGKPVRDPGGSVIRYIGTIIDITEWKRAEDALKESQVRLEAVFAAIPDMIVEYNARGEMVRANQAALKIGGSGVFSMGRALVVLKGRKPDGHIVHAEETPVSRALEGEIVAGELYTIQAADGKERTISIYAGPLAKGGSVNGAVSLWHDITELKRAEEALAQRNEILIGLNAELTGTQEELHRNVEELRLREQALQETEDNLRVALAEKEILFAEIHHRVKNNLASFIALLSLEDRYEFIPEGEKIRTDLQNRARSMALIHDTLYRTKNFSSVDMGVYLTTLVSQVAASYNLPVHIEVLVEAEGVILDFGRATASGLIVNELITNSYKYAFPAAFDCMQERGSPCRIVVRFSLQDGTYLLSVSDNGIGLPAGYNPEAAQSLGLRLVNVLATHQLRAKVTTNTRNGTEFMFRFERSQH